MSDQPQPNKLMKLMRRWWKEASPEQRQSAIQEVQPLLDCIPDAIDTVNKMWTDEQKDKFCRSMNILQDGFRKESKNA